MKFVQKAKENILKSIFFELRSHVILKLILLHLQNNGPTAGVTITSLPDSNNASTTVAVTCTSTNLTSSSTFSNPNFTLQDEGGQKQQ